MWRVSMQNKITGIILAGGNSLRMGQDKLKLAWGDSTLLEHVVSSMRKVIEDILIIVDNSQRVSLDGAEIHEDIFPGTHTLGALYTGLLRARTDRCFVVAADMPFLNPKVIQEFIRPRSAKVVITRVEDRLQTLSAVYSKQLLPVIKQRIDDEQWSLHGLVKSVDAEILEATVLQKLDPHGHHFYNINTPEAYQKALTLR